MASRATWVNGCAAGETALLERPCHDRTWGA